MVKIRELSSLFFTVDEIADYLQLERDVLLRDIRNRHCERSKQYYEGKYEKMIEMRKQLIEYAEKGSSQSDQLLAKIIQQQRKGE